jgi:hypothetical protein
MRILLSVLALLLVAPSYAQKASVVDIVQLAPGKPFPVPLLMQPKVDERLPFYSITVPMPDSSALNVFVEYDVDVMFDTKNVYALRAKRTFDSIDACRRALKSLIVPLTNAYRLNPTKSEFSLFEASAGDLEVHSSCGHFEGSPYPTLSLYISNKSERQRVREQIKKKFSR